MKFTFSLTNKTDLAAISWVTFMFKKKALKIKRDNSQGKSLDYWRSLYLVLWSV